MNYQRINNAILASVDVSESVPKDSKFYDYLLDNNVAYYYSSKLAKRKTVMDTKIIVAGKVLNNTFLKTVRLVHKICKKNNIKFLLFKTYKYIPEIVDGDMDLFIQKKDFHNFLGILRKEGFYCWEHEPLKAFCKKDGYSIIEPRVNGSFYELIVLPEETIWKKVESVKLGGVTVFKVLKEIDVFYLLLSVLYNPKYLSLYLLLIIRQIDTKKLFMISLDKKINQDLKFLLENFVTENTESKRFPRFSQDLKFVFWWYKRILPNSNRSLFIRLKHILFFFYSKYSYVFFNNLVFKHPWPLLNKRR